VASLWTAPAVLEDAAVGGVDFSVVGGPMLAGGRTGDVTLVYQRSTAQETQLLSRQRADGDTWSDAEELAATGASGFLLVDDGAGGAIVVWSDLIASGPSATVTARLACASQAIPWSRPGNARRASWACFLSARARRVAFLFRVFRAPLPFRRS
jgi:hypothetical protein